MVLIMRSILIDLVTMLVTLWLSMIGTIFWLSHSLPPQNLPAGTEVGWDLVTFYHSSHHLTPYFAVAAASFAVGFLWGYHRLSRH